jgi:hypothetical protein
VYQSVTLILDLIRTIAVQLDIKIFSCYVNKGYDLLRSNADRLEIELDYKKNQMGK